jgi:spore coat protein A
MDVNRRDALVLGGFAVVGAAGLALPFGGAVNATSPSQLAAKHMPIPFATRFTKQPVLAGQLREDADGPFRLFEVAEKLGSASIVPGLATPVYGYNGLVPGPVIKVRQGQRVKLRVRNQLPAKHPYGHDFNTSTHLHGSASLPQFDGYADDVAHPGDYKDYWYPNWQPARTLWYHDHNVHTTAQNAYSGLAAQYHLSDAAERNLLPQGNYDVPITISDVMFAADGSLAFDDRSHAGLMGDVILVNGKPWPVLQVKRRIYRFRVLNASISRSFRLRLSNGAPMVMVATDGGLMPKARPVVEYRHAGAERYEFLVDFSKFPVGTSIVLRNLSNKNNVDYDDTDKVMRFDIVDDAELPPDTPGSRTLSSMPDTLVNSEAMSLTNEQVDGELFLRLGRDDVTNVFEINSESWHDDVVTSGYKDTLTKVDPDEVQEWTIENRTGGGWFHPLHIHLVDFQIISRNGLPPFDYERGPKDVVYVAEDETVRVRMKFTLQDGGGTSRNAGGRYMIHCHNLPHEDHDMMHQFAVGDPDVNDPIHSAPCKPDDGYYDDGWVPAGDVPPTVTATSPADGAAVGVNVVADFSEPVTGANQLTMTLYTEAGQLVPAVVSVNATAKRAILNPVSNLLPGTTYLARVTEGIKDESGQPIEPVEWTFRTAGTAPAPPAVTQTVPIVDATGVRVGSNITATFTKPVTGVSAETMTLTSAAGSRVDAVVTLSSTGRVATLNPNANLARSTVYTVELVGGTAAIRDLTDAPLPTTSWSFTTL